MAGFVDLEVLFKPFYEFSAILNEYVYLKKSRNLERLLKNWEKSTKLKRKWLVLLLLLMTSLYFMFSANAGLYCNAFLFMVPARNSIKTLCNGNNAHKLLVYWIFYAKFTILDYFFKFITGYWIVKLLFFTYFHRLLHHIRLDDNPLVAVVEDVPKVDHGPPVAARIEEPNDAKIDPEPPKKLHTCPICLEEMNIYVNAISCKSDVLSNIDEDDHVYCIECIERHIESNIFELPLSAEADGIKCPQIGCDRKILHATLRMIIPDGPLKRLDERIQEQNLAPFKDIERCKICTFGMEIELSKQQLPFFTCLNCGAFFCRTCKRDAKPGHLGKTCEDIDRAEANETNERKIENEMSDAIIRKCPNCSLPFLKQDGCNKMTCRCGTTQCYICRMANITYEHFCTHLRDPGRNCYMCNNKCMLWQNAEEEDERILRRLRRRILKN